MSGPLWYPRKLSERITWHATFASQAAATGVADGLSAAEVAQIATDSSAVAAVVKYQSEIETFAQGFAEYSKAMLSGPPSTPAMPVPAPPPMLALPAGALPRIEARTRQYARMLRAAPGYNAAKGEQYGIIAPEGSPVTPSVKSTTPMHGHAVRLRIAKAGYRVLVVESRRGGGNWEQIGVSQMATFVDSRAPLAEGQPEVREYRIRPLVGNQPSGEASLVVIAVTMP